MAGQALGDLLSGAAGHPINRPALDAAVMQGQALAGLRTAQTEDALQNAQRLREENEASENLEGALMGSKDASGKNLFTPSQAHFTATQMKFLHGGAQPALEAWQTAQKAAATATLGDTSQLGQPSQTAAQQVMEGKVATPVQMHPEYATLPGAFQPNVQQTPEGQATTAEKNAGASLKSVQAAAGGYNPHTAGVTPGSPEDEAISRAVSEGRLDPTRLNSRNSQILAAIEMRNPGQTNFNRLHADAALQSNATFQQKTMTAEAIPTILQNLTTLGKKLGYSDNRTVGKMQAFMQGEFNDPDYAEYMPARNDALMSIASVMRGVGMSNQAVTLEHEAGAPTMSPVAFDGWLKGQMASLEPRLKQIRRVEHHGEPGVSNVVPANPAGPPANAPTPPGGAGGAANDPLGIR